MKQCERCLRNIPLERLETLPDTRLCVQCSEKIGGDYNIKIVEENLGNSIVSKPFIQKIPRNIEPLSEEDS